MCEFYVKHGEGKKRQTASRIKEGNTEDYMTSSFLTTKQTSKLLNVHENTVRRWSDSGIIKAYRVGPADNRRFLKEEVLKLLRESNRGVQEGKPELIRRRKKAAARVAERLLRARNGM